MRATKEEKRERERKKREEWDKEIARLYAKQNERKPDPKVERINARNAETLHKAHATMRGSEFRSWYEATTGEPVSEFLEKHCISREAFSEKFSGMGITQIEWTRMAIERVTQSNPWTNPETRQFWVEKIATAKPSERRRFLLRLATPRWANREKVEAIYRERERIIAETGTPHDVDHIVPIVHTHVCGLHCEFNLRIISSFDNRSKSNVFNGIRARQVRAPKQA
ncbi:hypothetical protein [Aromatoleum anaerobium]|uniref:HNH nuclease domain-containing protein n=1 Tax=Aromatoleum anaerobium TaxID=182180 RepID=A0ABX1PPU7_9RHOO|nr:hypothetical protein [Aromatoleum anaerobium]MCK0507928.1 hypothetical protein [Aromatoleum anaerobium]